VSLSAFGFRFYTVSEWGVSELFYGKTVLEHPIPELYEKENHNFGTPHF